ncbi:hypothetical protein LOTGIDRAFT_128361 [Lottia gigantea]|uniref:ABC transporter domain-containing protein n=1 Tax=Lottia gigantea TaxID=225164 RepID=V3ZVW8_LOTGI|nr:hypothetical protein LOTGIDRAFT_128361 [Lottia gigantea]ESO86760.1 hypothetical protein LOTGIDRAFT_128361 [Lottia gigantea]
MLDPTATSQAARLNIVNLSYKVKETQGAWYEGLCFRPTVEKTVLKNIDMSLNSGEVTAIIGSSGSGKTSLLDVVSQRCDGQVMGDIYFKNYRCDQNLMKSCTSYVMQADRLFSHLTVRESLRYTANFCLPRKMSRTAREKKVDKVILEMGLIKVADSLIGGAVIRGLSGGEKRRVSIAVQLLKDPEILILDEPTTGLDSFTARYLTKNINDISRAGKLVLMTIHQPRSDIFQYFDQVAILCQGELVYFGRADELVPHFTRLNFPCPAYANPLDNYIDVCSIDRRTKKIEEDTKTRIQDLIMAYRDSPQHDAMVASMNDSQKVPKYIAFPASKERQNPGTLRTIWTMYKRMNLNLYRDKPNFKTRIFGGFSMICLAVILIGSLENNQRGIQNRTGLIYQIITCAHMEGFLLNIFLFPAMRDISYRETRDGFYKSWHFLLAYILHTLPFHIISLTLAGVLAYWACGLYSDFGYFAQFVGVNLLICFAVEALVLIALRLVYDFNLVNMGMTLGIALSSIISSGLLRYNELPDSLSWIAYITPVKYGVERIVYNEYTNINITCDSGKFITIGVGWSLPSILNK